MDTKMREFLVSCRHILVSMGRFSLPHSTNADVHPFKVNDWVNKSGKSPFSHILSLCDNFKLELELASKLF